MRRLPILPSVLLGLLVSGCDSPTGPDRGVLVRTALAEARWLETRPARYVMEQGRGCECTPEMSGPVRARVEQMYYAGPLPRYPDEYIAEATYVATAEPVTAEYLPNFRTVPELFALIREAFAADAAVVVAEFDAQYGYPTLVAVDYDLQTADDEFSYTVSSLYPLDFLAERRGN
jgi:hypothetical protein